jgi:hypothetical protein
MRLLLILDQNGYFIQIIGGIIAPELPTTHINQLGVKR